MAKELDFFVHHVYFWLKNPVTAQIRKKFELGLKELVAIEQIVSSFTSVKICGKLLELLLTQ